jgi:hypothetical protein
MQFNDSSGGQGIVQDVYFNVHANSTTYLIADLTRNANAALDKVVSLILGADGRWQFDDKNSTDLPIGTTNLVANQQDYSFDTEYLVILDVICSDQNGNDIRLIPIDNADLGKEEALTQFMNVAGTPQYYDKVGDSILLYPKPSYSYTGGLKAYFQRKISYFSTSDTTKEPGFAKHLHKYISLFASYEYARTKGLKVAEQLKRDMLFYEGNGSDPGEIRRFYSYREKDDRKVLRPNTTVKL